METSAFLLHGSGSSSTLDMHVAIPMLAAGALALSALVLPMPRLVTGVRQRARLPQPTLLWPIFAAWALAIIADAAGEGRALHHDALIEGSVPRWAGAILFLFAWQIMITAMMLPTSLPLIRLFNRAAADQPQADVVRAAFVSGYVLIWTVFGALAFFGDVAVHESVDHWMWLREHTWLIGGSTLVIAGAFQFSDLKKKCLSECRHPAAFLLKHYKRGIGEAFRIGRQHGFFCLGCCWALMLVGFAVGVANLAWMAVLTALMLFEKTGPSGDRGVVPIGLGFIALGALVLLHPGWLPNVFFQA
jgi:predicted metal-binding membrane protein